MTWDRGTIVLRGLAPALAATLPDCRYDARVKVYRAPGWRYPELMAVLARSGHAWDDRVERLGDAPGATAVPTLRDYQAAALLAWEAAGRRGVVVLPTGAGKTRLAVAAIATTGLRTLCLVPTRVLLDQWVRVLAEARADRIGVYGDGQRLEAPISVATFASARLMADRFGDRFELIVIDEVHHFGGGGGDEVLELCIAPARLGLTGTPPDAPDRCARLEALVGPVVYAVGVAELAGTWLAPFEVQTLPVDLTAEERRAYEADVATFRTAWRRWRVLAGDRPWADFLRAASASSSGRAAVEAWRRSRALVRQCEGKRRVVGGLLERLRDGRVLIFTATAALAHALAREHLIPVITSDIGRQEREWMLAAFARGEVRTIVSARVLNEGVDVPEADVAVLLGGSQGNREYVQRVGRVLRPVPGKRALVVEVVARGTFESDNALRRQERAEPHGGGVDRAPGPEGNVDAP